MSVNEEINNRKRDNYIAVVSPKKRGIQLIKRVWEN
jgi:hypothetical protein